MRTVWAGLQQQQRRRGGGTRATLEPCSGQGPVWARRDDSRRRSRSDDDAGTSERCAVPAGKRTCSTYKNKY